MLRRVPSLPVLAVVALVALVLGSLGTAVAGPAMDRGLTKGKVTKIATKVVKKQAPTLTVGTATNAIRLDGQAASAYKSPTYTFVLPVQAPAENKYWNLPGIPAGTYLASYSVLITTATTTQHSNCSLYNDASTAKSEGLTYQTSFNNFSSLTATTLLTVGATAPRLHCGSDASFTVSTADGNITSRVTLVRVDTPVTGTVTRGTGTAD